MDKEKLLALAGVGLDEVERLSQELGKPIDVDRSALIMLARVAMHQEDGEGYMRSHVRILVEDMVRRFPDRPSYRYEFEPPDADERRQAGTFCSGMSLIQGEEEEYRDNIPENLQGSERYEKSDEACDTLSGAVDGLEDIITSLGELAEG